MKIITTRPPIHEVIVVILATIIMAASIGTLAYLIFVVGANGSDLDDIDCKNVVYSTNYTRTLAIMKFCTGVKEKEID